MKVLTTEGEEIDVSEWLEEMKYNHFLKRDILMSTPIGKTASKTYFWWDEGMNPALDKQSVLALIKAIKTGEY